MNSAYNRIFRFIPSALMLILLGFWMYKSTKPFDTVAYIILGITIFIVCFNLYFKIKSFQNEKSGLTHVDELSKRIKEKAASETFKFSIFMWVFGVLFLVDLQPREKIIIALGVIVMALFYFFSWFYYSKIGILDENKD